MQKNILVTGANGYIGRNVINYLIENNMNVIATDISLNNVKNNEKIKKIETNIFKNTEYFCQI